MPRTVSLVIVLTVAMLAERAAGTGPTPLPASQPVPENIPSPAGPGSSVPNLSAGHDGRVYMSWIEPRDSGHALKFAVLHRDRWTPARDIRTGRDFFVNWADFPSIIALADGRLAAHWLQRTGRSTYAYGVRIAQSSDGGQSWSAPVTPHRDSSQTEHGFVAFWREGPGLGVAWLDGRRFATDGHDAANEMMLLGTTLGADGKLGAETMLDQRTCDCCQNSAAITSTGPIVAYRNRSADEIRDIYVTRRVNGRWTAGTRVHDDSWKIAACPVNGPSIAASGNRVAVAWFTAANEDARVHVAFSNNAGASFAPPIRVDGGSPAGRVQAELLRNGDALVTWIERTGGDGAAVRVRRISASGKASRPMTIASSSAARASGFPRMAISGSNVIFAWTVPGEPSQVRVARAALAQFR